MDTEVRAVAKSPAESKGPGPCGRENVPSTFGGHLWTAGGALKFPCDLRWTFIRAGLVTFRVEPTIRSALSGSQCRLRRDWPGSATILKGPRSANRTPWGNARAGDVFPASIHANTTIRRPSLTKGLRERRFDAFSPARCQPRARRSPRDVPKPPRIPSTVKQ